MAPSQEPRLILDVRQFRPVEGPTDGASVYYKSGTGESGEPFLGGAYRTGMETVTMGIEVPGAWKQRARRIRWRWRVNAFPVGGDECTPGKGDSAASVNVAWKRGLKWYVLKYVWSSAAKLGAVCDRKRTIFLARDTIVLESGGEPGAWLSELVDIRKSFQDHFENGNPQADVPDLVGVAVLTDGDQTRSPAAAEWADFELE